MTVDVARPGHFPRRDGWVSRLELAGEPARSLGEVYVCQVSLSPSRAPRIQVAARLNRNGRRNLSPADDTPREAHLTTAQPASLSVAQPEPLLRSASNEPGGTSVYQIRTGCSMIDCVNRHCNSGNELAHLGRQYLEFGRQFHRIETERGGHLWRRDTPQTQSLQWCAR